MRYHKIEVDSEVMQFLKKHAEPFEDTPNSVLRKLLLGKKTQSGRLPSVENNGADRPRLSGSIPNALEQILEVVFLVVKRDYPRNEATNLVAKRRAITTQSVIDKYCRQLDKKAYEIDKLLQPVNMNDFKELLQRKFPPHLHVISEFFQTLRENSEPTNMATRTATLPNSNFIPGKEYLLGELKSMDLGKDTRPEKLRIGTSEYLVNNWTELCVDFVKYLVDKAFLTVRKSPIYNHADVDKYFINTEPAHKNISRDAEWKSVGPFFVDTKYNAEAHKRNIIHTLECLNVKEMDLAISFA